MCVHCVKLVVDPLRSVNTIFVINTEKLPNPLTVVNPISN